MQVSESTHDERIIKQLEKRLSDQSQKLRQIMIELNRLEPDYTNNPEKQMSELVLRIKNYKHEVQSGKLLLDEKETELVRFVKQDQEQKDKIASQEKQIKLLKDQLTVE